MQLIDADELLAEVVKVQALEPSKAVAKTIMLITEAEKVDAVEVVRCKDCQFAGGIGNGSYLCHYHGSDWNMGNHFCSYGERKDND